MRTNPSLLAAQAHEAFFLQVELDDFATGKLVGKG